MGGAYGKLLKNEPYGRSGDETIMDTSKLVFIGSGGGNRRLIAPAAQSWRDMRDASGNKWSFDVGNLTFRTKAQQQSLCPCDGKSKAHPGYSIHGWGRAVDFAVLSKDMRCGYPISRGTQIQKEMYAWLQNNAWNFGWLNYPAEVWHWCYVGNPKSSKYPALEYNPAISNSVVNSKYDSRIVATKTSEEGAVYDKTTKVVENGVPNPPAQQVQKESLYSAFAALEINSSGSTASKAVADGKVVEKKTDKTKTSEITKIVEPSFVEKGAKV